jgi:hypothetical protein
LDIEPARYERESGSKRSYAQPSGQKGISVRITLAIVKNVTWRTRHRAFVRRSRSHARALREPTNDINESSKTGNENRLKF